MEIHVQGVALPRGRTEETFGLSIQHVKKADEAREDAEKLLTSPRDIRKFSMTRYSSDHKSAYGIVRESADTIVSITERIKNNETIYPIFVLRLFRVIVRYFQHAFRNRPTQYRSLRFVIINPTCRRTCAYTTYDNRYIFFYCKERV